MGLDSMLACLLVGWNVPLGVRIWGKLIEVSLHLT